MYRYRKAIKQHICGACKHPINRGTRYFEISVEYSWSRWTTYKLCYDCFRFKALKLPADVQYPYKFVPASDDLYWGA